MCPREKVRMAIAGVPVHLARNKGMNVLPRCNGCYTLLILRPISPALWPKLHPSGKSLVLLTWLSGRKVETKCRASFTLPLWKYVWKLLDNTHICTRFWNLQRVRQNFDNKFQLIERCRKIFELR